MNSLLMASALFAGLVGSLAAAPAALTDPAPVPYNAFCRTLWLFATPCAEFGATLMKQIQEFNPMNGCEECQYMLMSATPQAIKANHTSFGGLQAEIITFTLNPIAMDAGCRVSAQSTSLGFTVLFDDGLNYCNLHNLLSASGLTPAPDFLEMTNEWVCLGFGLATCKA